MTAYFYSISQHFTSVDKNPYNGEKLMWSMLGSLDQECNAGPDRDRAASFRVGGLKKNTTRAMCVKIM